MVMKPFIATNILNCFLIFAISKIVGLAWHPSSYKTKFEFFKQKYDKKYGDSREEAQAFQNFIENWKNLDALNKKKANNDTIFMVNVMADKNPENFEEHFGVTVQPYVNELAETFKEKLLREKFEQHLGRGKMYDLDNAEKIYDIFLKKYDKHKPKNSLVKQKRYLRFVKTLAEINKHNFLEGDNVTYDENADKLKQPKEFFF